MLYINIHSKDASYEASTGKSSSCFCYEPTVMAKTKEWGDKKLGIEITGQYLESIGTGERGGTPKQINRHFEVWLDEEDLRDIILQALKSGLICFPGEKQILEAKMLLEDTLDKSKNLNKNMGT